jgi:5-aminolevulinate synthase
MHTDAHIAALVEAMVDVWESLKLPLVKEPKIIEFRREPEARCTFAEFKKAAE